MPRPPHGDVSEDDVKALFNEDGELRDPNEDAPEESEEAPEEESEEEEPEEADDEEGEEAESEDEEEEESEEDDNSAIDWEEVDPKVKSAFDAQAAEAQKWKKAHGKIQAEWTKESRSRREMDGSLAELQQRNTLLTQFEELLDANPDLVTQIQKAARRKADPLAEDAVPDYLAKDPLYGQFAPVIKSLQAEVQRLRGGYGRFEEQEKQQQEASNKRFLDEQLSKAGAKIKSMLGRDATEEDLTRVLEEMVETGNYKSGEKIAALVFADDYEKALTKRAQANLASKAKKFPARSKTVNARRITKAPMNDALTAEEAIARAMAEQDNN